MALLHLEIIWSNKNSKYPKTKLQIIFANRNRGSFINNNENTNFSSAGTDSPQPLHKSEQAAVHGKVAASKVISFLAEPNIFASLGFTICT